ncbi:FAA hydrolase family protein [Rhodohalobacter sp. SW132]|uniref:fumarylacetoacetate hydrolase family protein n=1 Tax=Rhodohalobacter sp. SW132 TaxID=2293433 RepID=UPI000E21E4E5|nr:fumarylacetoacetate hydrolase family protein [Rhodohalobacter sp. SW132]REL37711.1 FAA hydrolase family protein [Rhodohalobacter sp. SW132]
MKLIRFGNPGNEKPGIIDENGNWLHTSSVTNDYTPAFFADGGLNKLEAWLKDTTTSKSAVDSSQRLGPPVTGSGKIVCVGLNYADHAREGGMDIPEEPILFFKATSAIVGPNDDMIIPKNSKKTDWEVELAVVIGKKATYVPEEEALDYIAGYCVHNDYSEREFQLERGGQWVKGKSCDTFAPIGPYLATQDEVNDVHNLKLWLKVNGEMKQDGSTRDFIFGIPYLVSYISKFMTLHPGDIISTGTPAGVGLGFKPPQFLKPGDIVELGIDGLGTSKQQVKSWDL